MSLLEKFKNRNKTQEELDHDIKASSFKNYPHLKEIKPNERYIFHSDYYQVDDRVCTIMGFIHKTGADDSYPAFWGVNRMPSGLGDDVACASSSEGGHSGADPRGTLAYLRPFRAHHFFHFLRKSKAFLSK